MKKLSSFVLVAFLAVSFSSAYASPESLKDAFETLTFKDARNDLAQEHGLFIRPYFKQGLSYSSNVFKASDIPGAGEHDAVTWAFTPGVDIVHYGERSRIGASYEATFNYINRFGDSNSQDQDFLVYANLKPTENTYLNLSDRIKQTGFLPGSPAFENVNVLDNTFDASMGVNLETGQTLQFSYQNYDHDFQENVASRYSYNENKFDWRIYHNLNSKQKIYTGFLLGDVDFDVLSSRDTTYYEIPVGIEGEIIGGWIGHASVGIHHRNLHASSRNDLTHVVTDIGVTKTFYFFEGKQKNKAHPTTISFGFVRRPVESTFSTATTYDQKLWRGNVKHLFSEKLRGRASIYFGNSDFEDRVFTGSRIVVNGAVFATSPNQVKRSDSIFGWGAGLDYDLAEYLKLHFDYAFSRRESNVSGLDFTDHTLSVKTTTPF